MIEENAFFPIADWKYEVANGDTYLGYQEWVAHRCEAEGHELPRGISTAES